MSKSKQVDATLVMLIALCGFSIIYFSDKESYEYIWPHLRYFLLYGFGAMNALAGALLAFKQKEEKPLPDSTEITSTKTTIEKTSTDNTINKVLTPSELEQAVTDKLNEKTK